MDGQLVPRANGDITKFDRQVERKLLALGSAVQIQKAAIRAKARVGEFAIHEVVYLKSVQKEIELHNPDAADAVALIAGVTIQSIARSVSDFCNGLD